MKLKFITLLLVLLPATLLAQYEKQDTRVNLSFLMPELRIETQIGEITSLKSGIGFIPIGTYTNTNGKTTENTLEYLVSLSVEPRFYVSRERRMSLGKSYNYFSGGYVGIPAYLFVGKGFSLGALYGTQGMFRNSNTFFYNLGIGLGYVDIESEKNNDYRKGNIISEFAIGIRLK